MSASSGRLRPGESTSQDSHILETRQAIRQVTTRQHTGLFAMSNLPALGFLCLLANQKDTNLNLPLLGKADA